MWKGNNTSVRDDSTSGGFLNTTTNQLDTTENKGAARRIQNIVPLVISQIHSCVGEDFKLFGVTAQIIKLVGKLRNFEVQTTKANYTIEDHTGEITAVLWLENDGGTVTNLPSVKEGSYVEVFGSLRRQDGDSRQLMILRMFPVSDCNIIQHHLLRVTFNRLSVEADSKKMMSDIKVNNPGAALANSMSFIDMEVNNTGPTSGLTPMQQKVCNILATDFSQNGMSKEALLNHFPTNQHHQVNETLTFLSNEGHVYSTMDNDHFKVTIIN